MKRPVFWRLVVGASLVGALGQALYVVLSGADKAVAGGAAFGGAFAFFALRVRGTVVRWLVAAVLAAGALAWPLTVLLETVGIGRWASVVLAFVCPLFGYVVGLRGDFVFDTVDEWLEHRRNPAR